MPAPNSPLTDEHLTQINNMMGRIQEAKEHIALAKRAQIPGVDAMEQTLLQQEAQLARLKNVYFPMGY
jgi:hypothetical protein